MLKNERLLLLLLGAIQFTNIIDFMIMMPMGDILKKQLHITPSQYGWLVASYGLAAGVTAFLGVFYLDNIGRKKALLTAYAGFILGTISSAIVPNTSNPELNYWLFIGTRVLTGITGGLLGGLVLSIVGDVIPFERRGRAMAVVMIAFSLASILGVPLALILVDSFGGNWHIPFYFVSAMGLPIWIFAYLKMPALRDHLKMYNPDKKRTETIRLAFETREQRNALFFTMLLVLGQFTVISFLTPYMINNVGLRQNQILYIYVVGGVCSVVSGLFIGKMVDKAGRFRVFTISALLSIIPVVVLTHLGHAPLWLVLCTTGLFFIFVSGRMIPANTITTSLVKPEHRGGFMSLNSAVMSLSSGAAASIAGIMVSQENESSEILHYERVGYLAVASTLVALLVVRLLKKISLEKNSQVK
ncbi:MAG: MFS transporter [Flavobacteriales bacterium]|nr:MFS transporter [Flavobacteriales bacterium]